MPRHFKHPRTTQERRAAQGYAEHLVRPARKGKRLPTSWDEQLTRVPRADRYKSARKGR